MSENQTGRQGTLDRNCEIKKSKNESIGPENENKIPDYIFDSRWTRTRPMNYYACDAGDKLRDCMDENLIIIDIGKCRHVRSPYYFLACKKANEFKIIWSSVLIVEDVFDFCANCCKSCFLNRAR
jgi:hypothetical protein